MIKIEALRAGYGSKEVLRGINLEIASGEFIGILGPNACGKSTLVKAISGVISPTDGNIYLNGGRISEIPPLELAKLVAVIPQSTEIPFPFTGEELVSMGRFPHTGRFSALSESDVKHIQKALEETDTVALSGRLVTEISGGERQRLILARALAQQTPVLIMDEGTAAMDAHRKIDAFDLLRRKNREGMTVICVMHDLNLAALYCDRLIFMKEGEIAKDGPTGEVFSRETIEAVYKTRVEIFAHPRIDRPQAVFIPEALE
ncbi:ABC transporter ATP-binding protein [bacterium]|nr:MAG: ABC transporter ATP-binding protein [bacterium]